LVPSSSVPFEKKPLHNGGINDIPPNNTRQSVGAWWKKKEEEAKKERQKQLKEDQPDFEIVPIQLKPENAKLIHQMPDNEEIPQIIEIEVFPQPPLPHPDMGHYEFGPNYTDDIMEESLEERYEIPSKMTSVQQQPVIIIDDSEPSPYEVPNKPPRRKKGQKMDDIRHSRGSETWSKPYATSQVMEAEVTTHERLSRKPSRPAPPPPPGKKRMVSPYAVSDVQFNSPVRDDLKARRQQDLKIYQDQLQEVTKELDALERKGVEFEQHLRSQEKDTEELDDSLIDEWFSLVNQKNEVLKRETDLVYL
jgi:hypothetical protein